MGYLPEQVPLYGELKVKEQLRFAGELKGLNKKELKGRVEECIQKYGLSGHGNKLISNLSKGYKQRVGLAQAVINDPKVLILDEPTVGLDPKQIIELRQLIKEMSSQKTVLLSSHILSEVEQLCDTFILLNKGEVVDLNERLNSVAYIVRVANYDQELLTIIGSINNVASCDVNEGCILIRPKDDVPDIASEISSVIVNAGYQLLELKLQKQALEQVFLRTLDGEQQ